MTLPYNNSAMVYRICENCDCKPVVENEDLCQDCLDTESEMAYERMLEDGECFRGREAESYSAEQQAWIQRNLK